MKSIRNDVSNEIIIEKSRFITYLFHVDNTEDAKEKIEEIRKKYLDATHVVYGFITSTDERSNDNGEPKGTAGLPTIEVLRKENLTDIIAITVRYFGGIKLGAGGLLRAYTKGVTECLKKANLIEKVNVSIIELRLSYKDSSYLDKNLSLTIDSNKEYANDVKYTIYLLSNNLNKFKELFINFKDEYKYSFIEEKEMYA